MIWIPIYLYNTNKTYIFYFVFHSSFISRLYLHRLHFCLFWALKVRTAINLSKQSLKLRVCLDLKGRENRDTKFWEQWTVHFLLYFPHIFVLIIFFFSFLSIFSSLPFFSIRSNQTLGLFGWLAKNSIKHFKVASSMSLPKPLAHTHTQTITSGKDYR